MDGDQPRPDDKLAKLYRDSRGNGTSLLLDVPPDKHGRIPEIYVAALQRLRKNVVI
jgi:alpha-L-fucosidase